MRCTKVLVLIALVLVCLILQSASASVLGKLENGYKFLTKNRRVYDPSTDSEHTSPSPDTKHKRNRAWPATVKFSSFGVATLYVNGIIYSKLFSPHPWSITVNLAKGDVIGIKAEKSDNYVGVMVTISWKGRTYRSGRNVFKVRSDSYFDWDTIEQDAWNRAVRHHKGKSKPLTPFCSWKSADVVDFKAHKFDKKASFIWSLHSSPKHNARSKTPAQTVYIRHVMGGDRCPKHSKTKSANNGKLNTHDDAKQKSDSEKKSTGASTDKNGEESQKPGNGSGNHDDDGLGSMNVGIGGQSGTRVCKCRLVSVKGGTCYDMVTPGDDEGPCNARPCERQYECAHDGESMCLMRRMLTRVVMTGPRSCKKMHTTTDLLVPYKR
ncbi:hypothetical protein FGB62_14g245 [Gracilaria domingensis]|nr:hypothetical protein FGB62_14g245 [Gracilaria domingensis]